MPTFLSDDDTRSDIFIPPIAANFRNNCQDGNWQFDGEVIGGDGDEFMFFAFQPYFGDIGQMHQDKHWGQVWGYPVNEKMPPLVFCTYLKTSGLQSFTNRWSWISSQIDFIKADGTKIYKNPSRYIWRSKFIRETCQTPTGPGKYYLLQWETEEIDKGSKRYELANLVEKEMRANVARLTDPQGTEKMISLLGKGEDEKERAIAAFKAQKHQASDALKNKHQLAPATPF